MPLVRITTVYSRAARICLHLEWIFLPMGMGMGISAPVNLIPILIGTRHGFSLLVSWVLVVSPVIFLAIGLWRPMHRRYRLQRNSYWTGP